MESVVFEDIPGVHEDERRALVPMFNMDVAGFLQAQQLKVTTMKKDAVLGRHFHHYAELFTVLSGRAHFTLRNPATGEEEEFKLVPGKRLLVPAFFSHDAMVTAGTILIGLTEEKYISPEYNDQKE